MKRSDPKFFIPAAEIFKNSAETTMTDGDWRRELYVACQRIGSPSN